MRYTLLLMALLSSLLITACGRGKVAAAKPPAPVLLLSAEDLRSIEAGSVSAGPVISGALQPEQRADLRAEIAAVVLQVYKDNGEAVQRGDLLARLDDTAIRDALASAEEAMRAAQQAFDQSERQVQRLKTLQGQGMMSMQALEDAEVRRNNAQSDLVAARARSVTAQQQLRRTEVRAPFEGVVSERRVSVGDTVQVGRELMKVWDPRSMRFEGLVSADRLHELRIGQGVAFHVNGYPNTEFAGRIQRIDGAANAATRQVEVLVGFSERAAAPRTAGLFAEGRVQVAVSSAPMLPEASLVRQGDNALVWRIQGAVLNKVAVQVGERDARRGEYPVRAGLAVGDRVLRNPSSTLVDGQAFEFAPASAPGATAAPAAPIAPRAAPTPNADSTTPQAPSAAAPSRLPTKTR